MAERYTRILSLDNPQWNINSPVVFEKGALLRDNVANANLLQLQFRNIGIHSIKAIEISVDCFDAMLQATLEKLEFRYLDLDAKRNAAFGSNVPIVLNKVEPRDFKICINKILFADGTIKELDLDLHNIESPKSIEELGELRNQFEIEVRMLNPSIKCTTLPQKNKDYWYCACGAFNRSDDKECRVCDCHFDQLIELTDLDYLRSEKQQAKEKEEERQQQAKEREEERRKQASKKTRKYAIIAGIALVVIIAISFCFKQAMLSSREQGIFNSAELAYSNKEYLKAHSLYAQLPDYKEAQQKMDSIEFPLTGAWSTNIVLFGGYTQYYFEPDGVLFAVSGNKLRDKASFLTSENLCGQYSWVSWSVGKDGIYDLAFKDSKGVIHCKINVRTNNCIHWFYDLDRYDVNDPKTYETYYRTN